MRSATTKLSIPMLEFGGSWWGFSTIVRLIYLVQYTLPIISLIRLIISIYRPLTVDSRKGHKIACAWNLN